MKVSYLPAVVSIIFSYACNHKNETVAKPQLATITTISVDSIAKTTAICNCVIPTDGGSPVTAKGICWGTTPHPLFKANNNLDEGPGSGPYKSRLVDLVENTTYYVRGYAITKAGTVFGNDVSFTTPTLKIGDSFQGGIVAYIAKDGDPGYDPAQFHGMIAAPDENSTLFPWGFAFEEYDETADCPDTAYGTGKHNSLLLFQWAHYNCAACSRDGGLSGYQYWFLPSKIELNLLYANLKMKGLGNFKEGWYWSSSEYYSAQAWAQSFTNGEQLGQPKDRRCHVRAVKYF